MTIRIDPTDLERLHEQYAHEGVNAVAREFARHARGRFDAQTNAAMQRGLEQLIEDKLSERIAREGDDIPDFELPNGGGKSLRLSTVLRDGPVVLVFYRGAWCPYCNLHLKALQGHLDEMNYLGAQLVAVSPQTPDRSHSVIAKNDLRFPVLSDVGNHVARALGLVFEFSDELRRAYQGFGVDLSDFNGDESWMLPIPATFIVDQDRRIVRVWADVDYRTRAEPNDVVHTLRVLHEKGGPNHPAG